MKKEQKQRHKLIESNKDKVKITRSVLEFVSIVVLLYFIIKALFFFTSFTPYDEFDDSVVGSSDHGFLALSYLGVDRQESDTLIKTTRLDEELAALKDLGYVTVSQKDIRDYYYDGKPLPEKALYLMFEDGRKDTAMFAEKLLEKYNYKATIMTYAKNLEKPDNTFLSPKDIRKIEKTGYCELGTNGYRLAYINAYDRYDRFLGQLTAKEYVQLRPYLGRDYNHYLMDFLRDENRIPTESAAQMRARIDYDYDMMRQVYTEKFGKIPTAYVLMQANTGRFGNNDKVSDQNKENMEKLFELNFNREGFSLNRADDDEYDLTRMQPQAYWYTNHLLMRIWDDLEDDEKDWIRFVTGDGKKAAEWKVTSGAVQFDKNVIALTSLPGKNGRMYMSAGKKIPKDICVFADINGNILGEQSIILRTDPKGSGGIRVMLKDNHLVVSADNDGQEVEMLDYDLHELIDVKDRVSVEEDDEAAYEAELLSRSVFSEDMKEGVIYYYEGLDAKKEAQGTVRSVADGAEEYIAGFDLNDKGSRKLGILLQDDRLSVTIDGRAVAKDLSCGFVPLGKEDTVILECGVPDEDYSQRNLADDVYDGVFSDLVIKGVNESSAVDVFDRFVHGQLSADDSALYTIYDNSMKGAELVKDKQGRFWNRIIDWFIANL
ncbi:MAG: polysaccharide deacetylase family protein [Lachnospiraceae bacterium]|nr:polysaccharide deacetylase family protein [Lachnospiraceae bacterium]